MFAYMSKHFDCVILLFPARPVITVGDFNPQRGGLIVHKFQPSVLNLRIIRLMISFNPCQRVTISSPPAQVLHAHPAGIAARSYRGSAPMPVPSSCKTTHSWSGRAPATAKAPAQSPAGGFPADGRTEHSENTGSPHNRHETPQYLATLPTSP